MSTLGLYAQFTASKLGVDGLTVTWDVERITRADGTRSALVTGGATNITIGRRGLYGYLLSGADLTLYDYIATAITADSSVDLQEVPALWTLYSEPVPTLVDALPTAVEIRQEMDSNSTQLAEIVEDTGTTLPAAVDALPTAAEIWTNSTRTLTQSGASVAAAVSGSNLTLTNKVTFSAELSGLTIPATWSKIYFTAKESRAIADGLAVLQIVVTNPAAASTDGILYINGSAATAIERLYGSLTVDQGAGTINVDVADDATFAEIRVYEYDVKCLLADGTSQLLSGAALFTVSDTPTAAV